MFENGKRVQDPGVLMVIFGSNHLYKPFRQKIDRLVTEVLNEVDAPLLPLSPRGALWRSGLSERAGHREGLARFVAPADHYRAAGPDAPQRFAAHEPRPGRGVRRAVAPRLGRAAEPS